MPTIVRATPRHADDIARLIGQLREQEGLDEPVAPDSVLAYLEDPAAEVLVAVGGGPANAADDADAGAPGDDVGAPALGVLSLRVMLDLFHGRPTALIQELVVAEGHRGEGIGGALLDAAIARARERGCVEIGVTTGEHNDAGQAAYRSCGFEPEGAFFELHLEG